VTCQLGEWLEEKVLGSFVYVLLIHWMCERMLVDST